MRPDGPDTPSAATGSVETRRRVARARSTTCTCPEFRIVECTPVIWNEARSYRPPPGPSSDPHEAAEPVEAAPELLVAEADGVQVRFQDGWHEAKVGEIAGCQLGNGQPDADPTARPPVLLAPSYVASRAPIGQFGPLFLAEAA